MKNKTPIKSPIRRRRTPLYSFTIVFLCGLRGLCGKTTGRINQNNLFMQNKAKLPDAQINVSAVLTVGYENIRLPGRMQNKPKQTQNKPKQTQFQTTCVLSGFLGYPDGMEKHLTK